MRRSFCIGVSFLVFSTGMSLAGDENQVTVNARFLEVNNNFLDDVGVNFRGFVGAEYFATESYDDFRIGVNAKIGYSIQAGAGLVTLGGRLYGDLDYELNIDPYLTYQWSDNKIALGYVRSAEESIVKPFATVTTPLYYKLESHPLTLRLDTKIGAARVSASIDEYENLSIGSRFLLNDNTRAYAAAQYNLNSDYLSSTVGIFTKFNNHDIRLAYSCFDGDNHQIEAEAAYDFTDQLRGSVYAGFDFGNGNSSTTLAGKLNYEITDDINLSASLTHNSAFVGPRE